MTANTEINSSTNPIQAKKVIWAELPLAAKAKWVGLGVACFAAFMLTILWLQAGGWWFLLGAVVGCQLVSCVPNSIKPRAGRNQQDAKFTGFVGSLALAEGALLAVFALIAVPLDIGSSTLLTAGFSMALLFAFSHWFSTPQVAEEPLAKDVSNAVAV